MENGELRVERFNTEQLLYPQEMDNLHKPTSCATLSYFRVPSLALRAIHLVPRLRRVADLCSSTVSEMRICGYNAEEKILCRTPFPAYAVYHLHPR